MNIEFDLPKIHELLKHFYTVTHIQAALFDTSYNGRIAYPEQCNQICSWIHESDEGHLRCAKSGCVGLSACRSSGKQVHVWRCHAGFLECGLPIFVRSEIAGYVIFGQFINGSAGEKENILRRCSDILDDRARLRTLLDQLHAVDMDFINAAAHLMTGCLHSVLLEDAFHILTDPIWMRIDRYIDNNLHTTLNLQTIAEHNFVSPSTVSHKVKKATGKSVGEVILSRRMERAHGYLMQTDIRIGEIAQIVGISDYNYFSRVFRKTYGYSPSKFRKCSFPEEGAGGERFV